MSTMTAVKTPVIALLGQPNSGKSTLFNALTGSHQHVGNWPGKTVEKKEGYFTKNGERYGVTDLPGSYSLSANSDEEVITRDYIASGKADVVCILADAAQLERSMFMLADYAGMDCPAVLLLNLMDIAKEQGKKVDAKKIEQRLGIPVVPFIAANRKEYDGFYQAIDRALEKKECLDVKKLDQRYREMEGGYYKALYDLMPKDGIDGYSPVWLAAKALEGDQVVIAKVRESLSIEKKKAFEETISQIKNGALLTGDCKFKWIDETLQGAVSGKKQRGTLSKFDKKATSKRWGKLIAICIMLAGLIASFIPAAPIMMIGQGLIGLGGGITAGLTAMGAPPIIISLLVDVALNTVGFAISMIGFVFSVNLVFGLIEEVGYMARVSYVFDGTMTKLGLQGKAVMPFLVSFGCTIGGAAGTRVIDSWGQRVLTIALAWVVPCAATWSIVPFLSSLYFGMGAPLVIIAIFAVALLHMMITAKIFGKRLVKEEDRTGLIMELPPYHKPKWGALIRSILVQTRDILWKAIKVIFIVSLVFWLLTYTGNGNPETTILYRFGRFIEPVTQIFGFTWQTFLAFVSSAISKEAALGVLSTLYVGGGSLFSATFGGSGTAANLSEVLATSITQAQALSFIFAVTFNVPCLMAISSTYQETRSLKWTLKIALYYFCAALILAFLVYHIGLLIF
ncbi:ferrous iron transport protein B [Aequitasia blattaphilus]|uniref:Ferrous iron transport protein B n=1 Tax=Aequitasia blattaphilus TaxID=2949332 RepID=A0ABT1EED8_9FIRM|nr:ferrous iron transport protein B [Aequitasia blattaphilus]MCP1103206.1 ferrous iron transport protein B [Aequitasia blattaphilus]MCR8615846.1 ferrous iron transport protein B [Aequitasia blattaphilus]